MPSPGASAAPSNRDESEIWDDPDEATRKLSSHDIARTLGSATDLEMDWDEDDSATHMYESQHAQVIMPARPKPAAPAKRVPARPTSAVRPRTPARADVRAEVLDPNLAFPELKKADPATKDALADLPPVPQLKAVRGAPRRASMEARETRAPRQTVERPIARPRTITTAPSLRYPSYESQSPMSAALHPSAATRPTSGARIPTLQWAPTALVPSYAPQSQPQIEEDEDDAWAAAWEHAERAIAADEVQPHAYAEPAYAPQQAYAQPQTYAQPQSFVQPQQVYAQPQTYVQPQTYAQPQTMHGYAPQPSAEPEYDPHAYAQPYTQQPAFASPAPQVRQVTHRRADGPTMTSFPPSPVRYDQYGRPAYDGPTLGGMGASAAVPAAKPRLPKPLPAPAPVSYQIDEKPFARRNSILGPLFWSVIPGSALFGAVLWGRVLLAGPEAAVPPVASEPTQISAPAAAPSPSITPTVTPEPLPAQPAASTAAAAASASKSKRSRSSHDDDDSSSTSASRSSRSRSSHDDSDTSSASSSRSSRPSSHDSDSSSSSSSSRSSRSSHDSSSDIAAAPPKATRTREDFDTEPKSSAKESKGGIGILRLNSRPWSQVSVDGKPVGNTPQMGLRLSAGTHQISLVNPQMGMSKKFKVEVQADQIVTRVETLED